MLIYVVKMLLMKANNHGFLFTEKLLKFNGIQDKFRFLKFHKFTKTCKKLLHESICKKLVYKETTI
jgi:hypothetical protein